MKIFMSYYIELKKISINNYKELLKSSDLLPGRNILKNNVDSNFEKIIKQGIENLEELINQLKNKKKLSEFSKQSGVSEDYLIILNRELKSYHQNPIKIKDFPEINVDTIKKLGKIGVFNTLQLFDKILTPEKRLELSKQTGIKEKEILMLAKLTDLTRIRWVNHTFAYVLFEASYDTVQKVACADYKILHNNIKKLNEDRKIYKANIGLHDMKLCVEAAKNVSLDIKY